MPSERPRELGVLVQQCGDTEDIKAMQFPPNPGVCNDSTLPPPLQDPRQSEEEKLILESNPLEWSVTDVVRFIKLTDCAPLARIFQEQVQWLSVSSVCFLDSRSCLYVFACPCTSVCIFLSVQLCVFMCV